MKFKVVSILYEKFDDTKRLIRSH